MDYRTNRNVQRKKNNYRREHDAYIEGNVVRKVSVEERPGRIERTGYRTEKKPETTIYMNLGYVLFLVAALFSSAIILISYIQLQSDIIITVKNIAALESELNDLRLSNDEDYARAASSVDLEEIRRVAIGELGMRYAKEGQIINVTGEGYDYVRQLAEIQE